MSGNERSAGKRFTERLAYLVGLGLATKFFIDTTVQLFNPFLTIYAAGLGIGAVTMGRLVSVRNLMGLSAPLLGALADRVGYRVVMRLGLIVTGLGTLLLSTGGTAPVLVAAMVLSGVGQTAYGPNLHAYVSSKTSYAVRSRALGIVEYSWALAGIVGLFAIGRLIERFSWREPLLIVAGFLFASAALLQTLPPERHAGRPQRSGRESRSFRSHLSSFLNLGPHWKSAFSVVVVTALDFFAVFHVMIIHGGWLEREYGLGPAELGTVAVLLGVADWAASLTVSLGGDRIGKRRSVVMGVGGMFVFLAVLPILNVTLPLAIVSLVLPRFFFEFATVSNFPLISEQLPSERGKLLALSISGGLVGTTVAASTGPVAYLTYGVWGLGPVSAAAALASLALLLLFVRERPHGEPE